MCPFISYLNGHIIWVILCLMIILRSYNFYVLFISSHLIHKSFSNTYTNHTDHLNIRYQTYILTHKSRYQNCSSPNISHINIRSWSLRTGKHLISSTNHTKHIQTVFQTSSKRSGHCQWSRPRCKSPPRPPAVPRPGPGRSRCPSRGPWGRLAFCFCCWKS